MLLMSAQVKATKRTNKQTSQKTKKLAARKTAEVSNTDPEQSADDNSDNDTN